MTAATILGDWNLTAAEVAELAEHCGGELARGRGPDHAIVIGADVARIERLGKHGSDAHDAILYTISVAGVRRRVLGWNVWVGQKPAAVLASLAQLVKDHDPDVIVLNEAYRCGAVLRDLAGYRVHQGPNVGEGADVAVLVARRHDVVNDGVLQMQQRWTVLSHDKVHAGREYPFDRIRFDDGSVLRVLGIHFPTGHAVNATAVDESRARVIRWATQPHPKEHR